MRRYPILPLLPPLALALLACSARKEGRSRVQEPAGAIGSLVCVDPAFAAASAATTSAASPATTPAPTLSESLPTECPLLVVQASSGDSLSVLSPSQTRYRLPSRALSRVAPSPFADSLVGATEEPIDRMVPPPANPGVLAPSSDFGLLFRASGGSLDTLFPEAWPDLTGPARACAGWRACVDSLVDGPWTGFLRAPFLPPWRTVKAPAPPWRYDSDSGIAVPVVAPAGGDGSMNHAVRAVALAVSARERQADGAVRKAWIFLHAVAEGGTDVWVWRIGNGPVLSLQVPFMEQTGIENVDAEDLDGDGRPEIRVRTVTHYGDGAYESLYLLRGGPDGEAPRLGSLVLSGSSGEPGGSEVAGTWWTAPPLLYKATASLANEPDGAESHDLELEAFGFDAAGQWKTFEVASKQVVLFAEPAGRSRAQAWVDSLGKSRPEAARVGIRPLPRLVDGKLLWQPGAIAPDAAAANAWSAWDPRARVGIPGRK